MRNKLKTFYKIIMSFNNPNSATRWLIMNKGQNDLLDKWVFHRRDYLHWRMLKRIEENKKRE